MNLDCQFYVYRWIRLDTNQPFYVGKGKGNRSEQTKHGRNKYFRNILKVSGCEVEIMISNLTEAQAFVKEVEFITLYKSLGYCEANLTNGGEGSSGRIHSAETRAKISAAHVGKILSAETRAKMSATTRGRPGHIHTEETLAKISTSLKGRPAWNKGILHSKETCKKMSDSAKGKIFSEETKSKLSAAGKGRIHTDESKALMSAAKAGKSRAPFSAEWKAKLSAARKVYLATKSVA